MFKNREFAIRVRKNNEGTETDVKCEEGPSWDEKVVTTLYVTKTVLSHAAIGVCAYVLLDTYRQVQVAKNTNYQPR